MADTIPVLWAEDISVNVLLPIAILRAQVGPLRRMTGGLLEAEVTTVSTNDKMVQLRFDIVAPALNNARHRILTGQYSQTRPYPVSIDAECFHRTVNPFREAATDQHFIEILRDVLRSIEVKSLIQSLIALSNDQSRSQDNAISDQEQGSD